MTFAAAPLRRCAEGLEVNRIAGKDKRYSAVQTGHRVTRTLCPCQFLLIALFSIFYWLRRAENSKFLSFVFNNLAASFLISVLRVSWT